MKKRIISAVVLIPLLLVLALAAPKIVSAVVYGLLMALGSYELLYRTKLVEHVRLVVYACIMAFAVTMWSYFGAVHSYAVLMVMAFVIVLFAEMMIDHVHVHVDMVTLTMFAGLLVPYLLGALIRILSMKIGRYVILVPFIVAFLNDSGAYFVGTQYGKHKLAPVVSPNKSWEGVFGGMACTMVGVLLYAMVLQFGFQFHVNYLYAVLYGFLGAGAGVFGDLCFSIIKRQTGIKDYGDLIPGHGGVLDRFDSLMLVAPLIEVLLVTLPLAV